MPEKTQHLIGLSALAAVLAYIGWHLYSTHTAAPTSGDYLPYYGPPAGEQQSLAQENPLVQQVLPSPPSATTSRDEWRARSRIYATSAPVLPGVLG